MFTKILRQHNPRDRRNHSILKFFADGLNEEQRQIFVESIFANGAWLLPTEISLYSKSKELELVTRNLFLQIFERWVANRIEHSEQIFTDVKNPFVSNELVVQFREGLLSLKNLGFHSDVFVLFENFIERSNPNYLKSFLRNSLTVIVDSYNEEEIEFFFTYLSNRYIESNNNNYSNFIYVFLNNLAYSPKIHELSDSCIIQLKKISKFLNETNTNSNSRIANLTSILLIDLIEFKKLDLSESKYFSIINNELSRLEKGDHDNLEFYKFLKLFNFPFVSINFANDLEVLIKKIQANILKINTISINQKADFLYHYLLSSGIYFELVLFYIENCSEEIGVRYFTKFLTTIDELRNSFASLIFYDDFVNFKSIKGKIISAVSSGFKVRIDDEILNDRLLLLNDNNPVSDFIGNKYNHGFLNAVHLNVIPKARSVLKKISLQSTDLADFNDIEELKSFFIIKVNYSLNNKGSILSLIPEYKSSKKLIARYELKAFFTEIELYLVSKAYEYLKLDSPFDRNNSASFFTTPRFFYNYSLPFHESTFWELFNSVRPNIYSTIKLKDKILNETFEKLVEAFDRNEVISGVVKTRAKGGLNVDVFGFEVFLPGSEIDINKVIDYDYYIGKTLDLKVINIRQEFKNVVVSRKVLLYDGFASKRNELLKSVVKGAKLDGIVKNILNYGVFVDLGGIDGLIYISELSWFRVKSPHDLFTIGQNISVIVLDYDEEKQRLFLGYKQLFPNPWSEVNFPFSCNELVLGRVTTVLNYGAILEIAPGIEGLLHYSEFSASFLLEVGNELEVVISKLNISEKQLLFSHKKVESAKRRILINKFPKGSKHKVKIISISKSVIVVDLASNIEGCIMLNTNSNILRRNNLKVGNLITAQVKYYDYIGKKFWLDVFVDWDYYESIFKPNSVHKGKIIDIRVNGGVVSLENGPTGFVPTKFLLKSNGIFAKKGEELLFKIIHFKKAKKTIILSHSSIRKI